MQQLVNPPILDQSQLPWRMELSGYFLRMCALNCSVELFLGNGMSEIGLPVNLQSGSQPSPS